jgi:DMSO/TMAO reductase YedYZ heme-binding membrane subunit
MTITLVGIILILVFGFFLYKPIRKYHDYLYLAAVIASIVSFTLETTIINMGYLGLSFFIVVMFVTVLEKSEIKKRLMGIRAELAIIGSIFAITHGLKFIVFSIDFNFFWEAPLYFYIGIASVVIMLPLTITSFMMIRKTMKGKTWKKLHQLSYLFYVLVGVHLILIQNDRLWFYSVIFGSYVLMKGWELIQKSHKDSKQIGKIKPAV